MTIMVYTVAMNTESVNTGLVNAEPWLLRERQSGSWVPLAMKFSSTDQCITLFYVCFYLKTTSLIYIIDPLTLNSQSAAL